MIVDEVGYTPIGREECNLFFRFIANRYERASTIITSNKAFPAPSRRRARGTRFSLRGRFPAMRPGEEKNRGRSEIGLDDAAVVEQIAADQETAVLREAEDEEVRHFDGGHHLLDS